ncbi:hypothetical protein BDR03DRAFT_966623 [Suillus americanus]|nr:hypothetical protein BDR03DRAFT_966623 [Suillus americanus]
MNQVPVRVDGRFRLGDILGSGSYAVVYRARNIINDSDKLPSNLSLSSIIHLP